MNRIKAITQEPEVGTIYKGKVVKVMEFGAFVNFFGPKDGLVHISQLTQGRPETVGEVVKEGQEVYVKLLGFDDRGKVRLSMKIDRPGDRQGDPAQGRRAGGGVPQRASAAPRPRGPAEAPRAELMPQAEVARLSRTVLNTKGPRAALLSCLSAQSRLPQMLAGQGCVSALVQAPDSRLQAARRPRAACSLSLQLAKQFGQAFGQLGLDDVSCFLA